MQDATTASLLSINAEAAVLLPSGASSSDERSTHLYGVCPDSDSGEHDGHVLNFDRNLELLSDAEDKVTDAFNDVDDTVDDGVRNDGYGWDEGENGSDEDNADDGNNESGVNIGGDGNIDDLSVVTRFETVKHEHNSRIANEKGKPDDYTYYWRQRLLRVRRIEIR
jgi:hypothetical protein